MAMENKRIIQLNTERTTPTSGDYVMVDSATDGTAKYQLSKITDGLTQEIATRTAADTAINTEVTQLKENLEEVTELYEEKNFLYRSDVTWVNTTATVSYQGDDIVVTASSAGTYRVATYDIDVSQLDKVTISWNSKESTSEGAYPASIRVGKVENGSYSWIQYITNNPTTINVSAISTMRIALYVAQGASASGDYATFHKLQVEPGEVATQYSQGVLTAIDLSARKDVEKSTTKLNVITESSNLLFSSEWVEPSATVAINGNEFVLTAKSSGTYRNASMNISVKDIDAITFSFDSIPTGDHVRFGYVDSAIHWVKYLKVAETIDVSAYDIIIIGLYCTTSESVAQGYSIKFKGLMLSVGNHALPFSNTEFSSIDNFSRGLIEKLLPSGNIEYSGERIHVKLSNTFNANFNVWKDFKASEIPDIASYEFWRGQSIVIFNDVMFIFLASIGKVVTMDFVTKSITGVWDIPDSWHANSAQFTKFYYNDADTYPILMISLCSNQLGTDYTKDGCTFYRVQYINNAFVFTKLANCYLNAGTYGSTWAIDTDSNSLYCMYYKNGTYTVQVDNPTIISVFKCPTKDNIIAGVDTTFVESDAETIYEAEHNVFQGCVAHNGLLYVGNSDYLFGYAQSMWVYDVYGKRVVSIMKYNSPKEAEGLCIYNGKLYVQQRTGTDTESVNPMIITEYTFD